MSETIADISTPDEVARLLTRVYEKAAWVEALLRYHAFNDVNRTADADFYRQVLVLLGAANMIGSKPNAQTVAELFVQHLGDGSCEAANRADEAAAEGRTTDQAFWTEVHRHTVAASTAEAIAKSFVQQYRAEAAIEALLRYHDHRDAGQLSEAEVYREVLVLFRVPDGLIARRPSHDDLVELYRDTIATLTTMGQAVQAAQGAPDRDDYGDHLHCGDGG